MKIKPTDDWYVSGTNIRMSTGSTYDATPATNQPDWKERGAVFADVNGFGLLLVRGEYTTQSEETTDEDE